MYCTACGITLTFNNQSGVVCIQCFPKNVSYAHSTILYCTICGNKVPVPAKSIVCADCKHKRSKGTGN